MRKFDPLPGVSLVRLTPPPQIPTFVVRNSLLERLNKPAPRTIFIVAPSGYGKTVLASQWLNASHAHTFWYTVDRSDSPRIALFHLIEGIRQSTPDFAPWVEEFREKEFDVAAAVLKVTNEINSRKLFIDMVFNGTDNFSQETIPAIQVWMDNSPITLRSMSICNVLVDRSYGRAAEQNSLDIITAGDLHFTELEISEFAKAMGLNYSDSETKAAIDSAHGWPAGLHMIGKKLLSGSEKKANSPSDKLLLQYTVDALKIEEQKYLECLVLLKDITLDRANRITDTSFNNFTDPPLIRLANEGIFIKEVSPGTYQINPLIQDELRNRLSKDSKRFEACLERTLEVLSSDDAFVEVIQLLVSVGRDSDATSLGVKHLSKLINGGRTDVLLKLKKQIAPFIKFVEASEYGELILDAYIALIDGDTDQCLAISQTLEDAATTKLWREFLDVELWGMRVRSYFTLGDFEATHRQVESMLASPYIKQEYGGAKIRLTNVIRVGAAAAFLSEDLNLLRNYAALIDPSEDDVVNSVITPAIRALVALAEGRYKIAFELGRASIASSKRLGVTGLYAPFDAAYCVADYYRESGEEDLALEILNEYISVAIRHKVSPWLAAMLAKKARIMSQLGRTSDAIALIGEAREVVSGSRFEPAISRIIDEQELFARVTVNDVERIQELLFRMPNTDTPFAFTVAYKAKKSGAKSKAVLDEYLTGTPRRDLTKALISADVFKDNPKVALGYLDDAISIAAQFGAKKIFLAQSPEVQNFLLEISSMRPTVYMEQIASMIRQLQVQGKAGLGNLESPLTKRELDILRRLSSGLPITQIAGTLHISNNTIKTHLKSIYRKLDAENRTAAVEIGRNLLLISR